MNRIFLSYSHEDAHVAGSLFDRLTGAGFDVWKDDPALRVGTPFVQSISKALADCQVFIVLLSSAALSSEWVQKEIDMAMVTQKKIMPILLEDLAVPPHLATVQYLPMKGGVDDWLALHKLVNHLDGGTLIPRVYNLSGQKDVMIKNALLLGASEFGLVDLSDPDAIRDTAVQLAQQALPYLKQADAGIVPPGHPALACPVLAFLLGAVNYMPRMFPTYRNTPKGFVVDGNCSVGLQDIRDMGFEYRKQNA